MAAFGVYGSGALMNEHDLKPVRGHVSPSGRISIPAEFRRVLGLERGGDVVVELDGKDIRIRTVAEIVARAQELSRKLLAGKPDSTVDDFLAERRRDWGDA